MRKVVEPKDPGTVPDPDELTLQNGELVDKAGGKKFVPHAALHSERETHKATKAKLQEKESQLQLILELLQNSPQAKAVEGKKPDADPLAEDDVNADLDPLGAIAQMQRRQKIMTTSQLKAQASDQQLNATRTVVDQYVADGARFRLLEPTFGDAYVHWRDQTAEKYRALGVPDHQLDQAVKLDELNIVRSAIQRRMSPAETVFKLAKAGGFKQAAVAPSAANGKANGAVKPAAEDVARLASIANGKEANASLGDLGGQAGEGLTSEAFANMPMEKWDRMVEKLEKENPEKLRRLINGREV